MAAVIWKLKEKDYTNLPVFLQRFEAFTFIDVLAKELINDDIIPLTIHDSIIVEDRHKDRAYQVIKEVFQANFGAVPHFHIKNI